MKLRSRRFRASVLFSVLLLVAIPFSSAFATAAARIAGAGADVASVGSVTWANPGSITANDGSGTTALIPQQAASHYLQGSSFGFSIPPEATILGIQVTIQRKASHISSLMDAEVRLVKGGSPVGDNKADSLAYGVVYADAVYGGANNLWGTTWTPAEINSPDFGVAFSVTNSHLSAARTAAVDFMQVVVTFKTATLTSVSCTPGTLTYGSGTTCTATVAQSGGVTKPGGTVEWSTGGSGNFSPGSCVLSVSGGSAKCSVTYTPSAVGLASHVVTASYLGNAGFMASSGNQAVTVMKASLTVTAHDKTIVTGQPDPLFTFGYSGFIGTDNSAGIDIPPSCDVTGAHTDPGQYFIVCGGGADDNYSFSYVDGILTVELNSPPTNISLSKTSLSENHQAGFTFGKLTTTDGNASDSFSYSFCGGTDDASFTLAGNALKTAAKFNFEAKSSYSVCIRSTDAGSLSTDKTFPLTVTDLPESFRSAAATDGFILESSETSSTGGTLDSALATFAVGDDALNRQYRSILSFNTLGLPDNAVITKATLRIRRQGIVGTNPFTTHTNLLVDIRKGPFGASALELGDFKAASSLNNAAIVNKTALAGGWYSAPFKPAAWTMLNKTGLTQLRLRFQLDDNNDLGADLIRFYSGNYATAASRPVLVVEFYIP